jgi:hypothetical protein
MNVESPFVTVSKILNEPVNTFDDLRIIAKDCKGLSDADKEIIASAADELEASLRGHLETCTKLVKTQARLIAVNDRLLDVTADLIEARKLRNMPFPNVTPSLYPQGNWPWPK